MITYLKRFFILCCVFIFFVFGNVGVKASDESKIIKPFDFAKLGYVTDSLLGIEQQNSGNSRYIVFEDDESSNFTNAEPLFLDNNYLRCFNNLSDYDYFFLASSTGDRFLICNYSCDINSYLSIYQKDGTGSTYTIYKMMQYQNVSSSDIIFLPKGYSYYFVFNQTGRNTGFYEFSVSYYNDNVFNPNNYLLKMYYTSTGIFNRYELIYKSFDSYPSANSHGGYIPSDSIVYINNSGSVKNNTYGTYFDSNASPTGIFDANGNESNYKSDDDRYYTSNIYYPAQATLYLEGSLLYDENNGGLNNTPMFHDTSFLVGNRIGMSAAHSFLDGDQQKLNIASSICSFVAAHSNSNGNILYDDVFYAVEAYLPMKYVLNHTNNANYDYDWAVIKYNKDTDYCGYFGIKYDTATQKTLKCFGYPNFHINIGGGNSGVYSVKLLASSGTFNKIGNYFTSFVDSTFGQSGGPCFAAENSNYYVYAIVHGGDNYINQFCSINKTNFGLVGELINE